MLTALIIAPALTLVARPADGYLPSLEELYERVTQRQPSIQRAIIETRSYVFDPLQRLVPANTAPHADAHPPELNGRGFRQKIYWIRNQFLGIETFAEDGTPLHFYLHEGFRPVLGDLTGGRSFSEADVLPPFLAFVSADAARWRQGITYWGLNPRTVELARASKGRVFYRLVEDGDRALWLEPARLRPVKLQTLLAGPGEGQRLTLEFAEFMFIGSSDNDEENFYFPRTVNYLLNGRLFKQTVVLRFEADPSVQGFPITRLRNLAARVQPQVPVSLAPQDGERP